MALVTRLAVSRLKASLSSSLRRTPRPRSRVHGRVATSSAKHAVATRAVDAKVLAHLYEVADDRYLPAELRPSRNAA